MKSRTSMIILFFIGINMSVMAQANSPKNNNSLKDQRTMTTTTNKSAEAVKDFFNAFSKGDAAGLINCFDTDAIIVAVKEGSRTDNEIYGTYRGRDGAKDFITNLGKTFDTKAFNIDHIIGEGAVAFANGSFTHLVKSTGKLFSSAWALSVVVKDGKILEYRFYEDSASFMSASTN
jgi:ketosteroid isomerase-like protein